jgi:serine/threonine-protein kinase
MVADDESVARATARLETMLKGKYRLDAVLGIGGMATVYRATHRNRAQFAVKMLHPELSMRAEVRNRFLREGYAANSVSHPGVVRVVDDDVEDGAAFLVMDLLEGLDAEKLAGRSSGKLSVDVAASITHELLDVLAAAHRAGIVHRDVKPANVFLCTDGTVKVLDFGIARVVDATVMGQHATASGGPIGTPAYMAPEQALARSDEIGAWTDIWAAGATLFTLLSGRTVHDAPTTAEALVRAATAHAKPLAEIAPDVPPELCAVVDKALAFEKSERWASAADMRAAIATIARRLEWPPATRVIAAAVASAEPSKRELQTAPTITSDPTVSAPPPTTTARISPPPRKRRWPGVLAVATLAIALGLGGWKMTTHDAHPAPSASAKTTFAVTGPTFVLVPGLENKTLDPLFDGGAIDFVIESALTRSAMLYPFAGAAMHDLIADLGASTGAVDDASLRPLVARLGHPILAVRGRIESEKRSYVVSVHVVDVSSGARVAAATVTAKSAEDVVPSIGRLVIDLRNQLGEPTDASDHGDVMGASPSLDADQQYAAARGGSSMGRLAPALVSAERAIAADPTFSLAQTLYATLLYNDGRESEARKHLAIALANMGRLSERERVNTEQIAHIFAGDPEIAVADCEKAIARWPVIPRSPRIRLVVAYMQAENVAKLVTSARAAVDAYPNSLPARGNALQADLWEGDFDKTVAEGDHLREDMNLAPLTSVAAYALLGKNEEAKRALDALNARSPAKGRIVGADLAIYEGREGDAESILRAGISAHDPEDETASWATLAELYAMTGKKAAARDAAKHALASDGSVTQFRAGRSLIRAGFTADAAPIIKTFSDRTNQRARLYAALLTAEASIASRDGAGAIATLARPGLLDSWLVCATRAKAHAVSGDAVSAKRDADACWARRGQGAMAFPEYDSTTLRYLRDVRPER